MTELETFGQAVRLSSRAGIPLRLAGIIAIAIAEKPWPLEEVLSNSRLPHLVAVRRTITQRARTWGYSYPTIGKALGRDHSTVLRLLYPRGPST